MSRAAGARHWRAWTRSRCQVPRPPGRRARSGAGAAVLDRRARRRLRFRRRDRARLPGAQRPGHDRRDGRRPLGVTASTTRRCSRSAQDHFGAQWTERPALVRLDGGWRMYVEPRDARHQALVGRRRLRARRSTGSRRRRSRQAFTGDATPRSRTRSCSSHGRRLARVALLPPARPAGPGGPHEQRVRDVDGRPDVGLARDRARRPRRRVGLARRASVHDPAGRPRRLRRPRQRGGELVRAHRARACPTAATTSPPATPSPTCATWRRCRCPAAATGSSTRRAWTDETHELRTELCAS